MGLSRCERHKRLPSRSASGPLPRLGVCLNLIHVNTLNLGVGLKGCIQPTGTLRLQLHGAPYGIQALWILERHQQRKRKWRPRAADGDETG